MMLGTIASHYASGGSGVAPTIDSIQTSSASAGPDFDVSVVPVGSLMVAFFGSTFAVSSAETGWTTQYGTGADAIARCMYRVKDGTEDGTASFRYSTDHIGRAHLLVISGDFDAASISTAATGSAAATGPGTYVDTVTANAGDLILYHAFMRGTSGGAWTLDRGALESDLAPDSHISRVWGESAASTLVSASATWTRPGSNHSHGRGILRIPVL